MKRAQFNFVWIFALLAGGAILALAIWGATQVGDTLRYQGDTETAASISALTNPLQAGFADGKAGKIVFRQDTRITNICSMNDDFGKNEISIASRSGVGNEWNMAGGAVSIHNKYIFSKETTEGESFYVFSTGFDFPYKVADLLFLVDGEYCFVNAPEDVKNEISGIDNIIFDVDNCSSSSKRVCFGSGSDCDMTVYDGIVLKDNGDELHYVGDLMWGAIFSDKEVYECNVRRLLSRAKSVADIYSDKANMMNARDCGSNLDSDLRVWSGMLDGAGSDDLPSLAVFSEQIGDKNDREVCRLW